MGSSAEVSFAMPAVNLRGVWRFTRLNRPRWKSTTDFPCVFSMFPFFLTMKPKTREAPVVRWFCLPFVPSCVGFIWPDSLVLYEIYEVWQLWRGVCSGFTMDSMDSMQFNPSISLQTCTYSNGLWCILMEFNERQPTWCCSPTFLHCSWPPLNPKPHLHGISQQYSYSDSLSNSVIITFIYHLHILLSLLYTLFHHSYPLITCHERVSHAITHLATGRLVPHFVHLNMKMGFSLEIQFSQKDSK